MGGTAILGKEMLEIHPVIRDGAIVWENDRGETATVIVYLTMLHTGILPNARGRNSPGTRRVSRYAR